MAYKKMNPEQIKYIVVHCAATRPGADIGAKDIDRWHRERGWLSIGYHYVIRRNGVMEQGRPEDQPGAHARGFNDKSIGICLVGGVDDNHKPEDNFTAEQYKSLGVLIDVLAGVYPGAEVLGHRDLPDVAKACPSFDVRAWLQTRKQP